jgi:cephalosporin hydroxylase
MTFIREKAYLAKEKAYSLGLGYLLVSYAIKRYEKLDLSDKSIEELFDIASSFSVLAIDFKPIQIKQEFLDFANLLKKEKPSSIIEIGIAHGGTLFMACKVAEKNAKIVSLDLPDGAWRDGLLKRFATNDQSIEIVRGDSHSQEVYERTKNLISGADMLFIDGDHSYNGVKKDFQLYSPLVRKGGMIVLHDINIQTAECETKRFWNEIKEGHKYVEFIEGDNGYGIGVLYKKTV